MRPLGQESDKAFALLNALDDAQRKQAILNYRVADLVLGPGQDGKTIQPEGLKASAMNEHQRAMLLDLISEWAGIIHESAAAARMAEIKADIDETWFAWSGPTTVTPGRNITAYYRIQGRTSSSSTRPSAWAAIPPCISIPCTVIRRTTTAGGRRQNEHEAIAAAAILLSAGAPASAHRLDEYLQATSSRWRKTMLQAVMRLIPGVAVSAVVLASIDTNEDGAISQAEQRIYAERVLRDLSLTIDGKCWNPSSSRQNYQGIEGDEEGRGEIQLAFAADLPARRAPTGDSYSKTITRAGYRGLSGELPGSARPGYSVHRAESELRAVVLSIGLCAGRRFFSAEVRRLDADHWFVWSVFGRLPQACSASACGTSPKVQTIFCSCWRFLLPAPLLAALCSRWTGFGGVRHCLLQILKSCYRLYRRALDHAGAGSGGDGFPIPSRPIEVLIAVSIFVSAAPRSPSLVPGSRSRSSRFFRSDSWIGIPRNGSGWNWGWAGGNVSPELGGFQPRYRGDAVGCGGPRPCRLSFY